MPDPKPTTASHVGPSTYDHHKPAIAVKEPHKPSYAFLSYNPPFTRDPSPDTFQRVASFSELHTKGPIFSEELKATAVQAGEGRNRHLQKIVKEKMTKIYPKLAEKKFSVANLADLQDGDNATATAQGPSLLTRSTSKPALTRNPTRASLSSMRSTRSLLA